MVGLALVLLADAAVQTPPPAALAPPLTSSAPSPSFDLASLTNRPLGAAEALMRERSSLGLDPQPCPKAAPGEIVVCARRQAESAKHRLPLRDYRFEEGEIVRYAGEADASADVGHSCARPGSCEPSKLMGTLFGAISSLIYTIKGEDRPAPPYPAP